MPPNLPTARLLLLIVAASYLLSALLLGIARARGATVNGWMILAWLACGIAGGLLATQLAAGRPVIWVGLLLALLPLMIVSLVLDARLRIWPMVVIDVSGVFAIAIGLWLGRQALGQI